METILLTTVQLVVGLYTNTSSGVVQEAAETLNTTDVWKKIYINLTNVANKHADAGGHKIFIGATNNAASDISIYLDNIKLVY